MDEEGICEASKLRSGKNEIAELKNRMQIYSMVDKSDAPFATLRAKSVSFK